jgi:hypothetical protein
MTLRIMPFRKTSLNIMPFSITINKSRHSIMTLSIMTLSIMTLSIMTLGIPTRA